MTLRARTPLALLPLALALAIALAAAPARAALNGAPAAAVQDAIEKTVTFTNDAVINGSDERVYGAGVELQRLIGGGRTAVFRPLIAPPPRPDVDGKTADIDDLLREGRDRLTKAGARAKNELWKNLSLQESLAAQQRVGVDAGLADNEMGVFRFNHGHASEGRIDVNPWLSGIVTKVGRAFGAATLFHEAGHAGDGAIDSEGVIDGEITAFQIQYKWLCLVDPTGHKLAVLRNALAAQMRASPGKLTKMAIDYAASLDVLRGTGGDPAKIKAFAAQLGYREGEGKTSVPLPGA